MSEKKWLISKQGRILGPFTLQEVIKKVEDKELSIHDEVSPPDGVWLTFDNYTEFHALIKDLTSEENTDTYTDVSSRAFKEVTKTYQEGTSHGDTVTIQSDEKGEMDTETSPIEDNSDDYEEEHTQKVSPSASYTVKGDPQVQKKAFLWGKKFFFISGFFFFVVGMSFSYYYFIDSPKLKREMFAKTLTKAYSLFEEKDFKGSFEEFQKIYTEKNKPFLKEFPDIYFYLGVLYIKVVDQPLEGRKNLLKFIDRIPAAKKQKLLQKIYGLIAISYLKQNDASKAEEYFLKALKENPQNPLPRLNLVNFYLTHSELKKAKEQLDKIKPVKTTLSDKRFLLGIYYLLQYEKTDEEKNFYRSEAFFEELSQGWKYRQQALLLLAYLKSNKEESENFDANIKKILNVNPYFEQKLLRRVDNYNNFYVWGNFQKFCVKLLSRLEETPYTLALKAYCHALKGQLSLAREEIKEAIQQEPKDPLLHAMKFYVFKESQLNGEASLALGYAIKNNKASKERASQSLPFLLQAQFCERQKDFSCSKKYWEKVLELESKNLEALIGLGMAYFEMNNIIKASENFEIVKEKIKLNFRYKPYLELRSLLKE